MTLQHLQFFSAALLAVAFVLWFKAQIERSLLKVPVRHLRRRSSRRR